MSCYMTCILARKVRGRSAIDSPNTFETAFRVSYSLQLIHIVCVNTATLGPNRGMYVFL